MDMSRFTQAGKEVIEQAIEQESRRKKVSAKPAASETQVNNGAKAADKHGFFVGRSESVLRLSAMRFCNLACRYYSSRSYLKFISA